MSASRCSSTFQVVLFSAGIFGTAVLISPQACRAQYAPSGPGRNNYTVSVRELRMGNKGQKAFDKGSQLLEKGDTAASITYLDRAIAEYPENYKAYYNLGVAQYRLGHLAEAEQAFQKSIDLTDGKFAPPEFGMGMILCQKSEFQQAEAVIERGLEREPGSANGKYFLAWAQYGLNRLIDAERSLRQALLRNAKIAEAYLLLARIHQRQHNSYAMAKDLQTYLAVSPNSPDSAQAKALLERTRSDIDRPQIRVLFPLLIP
jgi:tetratricopeptide (TPR) repeat protein